MPRQSSGTTDGGGGGVCGRGSLPEVAVTTIVQVAEMAASTEAAVEAAVAAAGVCHPMIAVETAGEAFHSNKFDG